MQDFNKILISRLSVIFWLSAGSLVFFLSGRVLAAHGSALANYFDFAAGCLLAGGLASLVYAVRSFRTSVDYYAEMTRFAMQMLIHDLKNPLTSIMMSISLARKETENNQMTANILLLAEKGAQLQQKIMDTVNDVDALESGDITASVQQINLKEVIAETSAEIDSMTHDKHLAFELYGALDGTLPEVISADRVLLKNILLSLLLNSYKYAPRNSVISLNTGIRDGFCVFQIIDKGTQLNPGDADNIFRKFIEREVRKKLPRKGLGFSLYYAFLAVKLCGGSIKAFNREDGVVTEFSIPQAPVPAAVPAA